MHRLVLSLSPKNGLGFCGDHVGVEVLEDLDLVVAADAGQDRLDLGIGEGGVDVPGPVSRARPDPSGRVLDGLDAVLALEPPDPELEGSREHLGKAGAGGEHGDLVTGFRLLGIDHHAREVSWLREIASDPAAGRSVVSSRQSIGRARPARISSVVVTLANSSCRLAAVARVSSSADSVMPSG